MDVIAVRNSSCGKVMFSQAYVKNSVHGSGRCTARQADIPLGSHPVLWEDTPPPGQTPRHQTATAADDTHPTGMHSCFTISSNFNKSINILNVYKGILSFHRVNISIFLKVI